MTRRNAESGRRRESSVSLVRITLNGREIEVESGRTILEVARANGVEIPTLCNDEQLEPFTSCWVCAVKLEGMRRYVPSCGTRVTAGMKVWTDTEDVRAVRKMALELLLSNHRGDCIAPCKAACPAGVDVQGYIALIAQRQYREATKLVKDVNPFPLSIGRVCTRPCEAECRRNAVDGPVAIDYLKRFAADWDISHGEPYSPPVAAPTGKRVAAIGAGPASLTLAYYLRQRGHDVTVFEALPAPGGMLRYGIPEYRLPKKTLDEEIGLITKLGVDVRYGTALGRDFTLADLFEQGFGAVFLGMGAMGSRRMKVEGEDLDGVWAGTEFLKKMGLGEKVSIGRHVAVIGGGNTAVDAARTSLRLGAEKVTIVYRRSRKEMPAWDVEVDAAEHEGVEMHFLAAPTRIEGDGRCERLEYIEMELGEPDASGRRRPVPIEGSEKTLEVDNVIAAIGQVPDLAAIEATAAKDGSSLEAKLELTRWGTIVADEASCATTVPGVYAGGDVVTGAATAIEAIAAGGRAADAIDRMLKGGESAPAPFFNMQKERWDSFPEDELRDVKRAPRQEMPELPVGERVRSFDEVELGYTEEQALAETERCLECGCVSAFTCTLRKHSAEYGASTDAFRGEVVSDAPDHRHPFIRLEPEKCILCGRCVRICEEVQGAEALGFFRRGFSAQMKPALAGPLAETSCESCGQCVTTCPTAALSAVPDLPKPGPWAGRSTPSTCSFCGTGCAVTLHTVGSALVAVEPVPTGIDGATNLCVRGRFGLRYVSLGDRVMSASVRTKGGERDISPAEAASLAVDGLRNVAEKHGADSVAVFVSPRVTSEAAYGLVGLCRDVLGTSNIGSLGLAREAAVFGALERAFGRPASTATYDDVDRADVILLLDSDIAEEHTVASVSIRRAVRRGARLIVVSPVETRMARIADMWVQAERDHYGDVLSAMIGRVMDSGVGPEADADGLEALAALSAARPHAATVTGGTLEEAADAFSSSGRAVLVASAYSFEPGSAARDAALAVALSVVAGAAAAGTAVRRTSSAGTADDVGGGRGRGGLLFMRARANGQGLADLGLETESPRLAAELVAGTLRAALFVGEDPIAGADDPERVREALSRMEFLAVADSFDTAATALAHCVIPLAAPGEFSGSYTSSESRVRAVNAASASGAVLSDLGLVRAMATAAGGPPVPENPAEVRAELAATVTPGYPTGAIPPEGVLLGPGGAGGRSGAGRGRRVDLTIPALEAPDALFHPRWTDSLEVRFSKLVEEKGLPPHVVRRHRLSA